MDSMRDYTYVYRPLVILVDALDECNEPDARYVVSFLELLSRNAIGAENILYICLSSRHYPNIGIERRLELVVEDRSEHAADITIYVQHKLRIRDDLIERELLQKENGIFMWVILVVEMLNRAFDEGRIRAMRQKLHEVPSDLDTLYSNLLKDGQRHEDRQQTILILQLVLFARRILSPEELYFAVLAGTEPEELGAWDRSRDTPKIIQRFIISASRGLIEVPKDYRKRVQFIHGSVNDFLLRSKRLQNLDSRLEPHAIGKSHDRIATCCMSYIMMKDLEPVVKLHRDRKKLIYQYPFLEYACAAILFHAEKAQARFVTQESLVKRLHQPQGDFKRLSSYSFYQWHDMDTYEEGAEFLYTVARNGYYRLAELLLLKIRADVNTKGGEFGTVLQAAAYSKDIRIVQLLLEKGADVNTVSGEFGTALQAAAINGKPEIVQLLLEKGADATLALDYRKTPKARNLSSKT